MLDPDKDSGQDEADPYVLGVARNLRKDGRDARVITEERRDTNKKMSVNTAAGILGIPSVPVFVYRVEARKSAKWCAGLVRMCRYVQYGSRGRQTGRFEGARARG